MEERSYRFTAEEKVRIQKVLLEDQKLPQLPFEVSRVSYQDGCKVYFKNGGWVSARFSGTEPLLRIFCEMEKRKMQFVPAWCLRSFRVVKPWKYEL